MSPRTAKNVKTTATDARSGFLEAFESFERERGVLWSPWLAPLRRAAIASFAQRGFPTVRDEAWRFTNVGALARTTFEPAAAHARWSRKDLPPAARENTGGIRLVFVNGVYAAELSTPPPERHGLRVSSLGEMLQNEPDALEPHLGRHAAYSNDSFAALNTAFFRDGAYVHVPARTAVPTPIWLVHVTVPTAVPLVAHPRNLVVADEGSQVTIVESFLAARDGVYFTNGLTEFVVADSANVDHYRLQCESDAAYHVALLALQQQRDSHVSSHCLTFGAALSRTNIHAMLAGAGCNSKLNGLFVGRAQQHMDNHLRIEHAAPHTSSRENFRGILDGAAHGVFSGRILVHKAAQKTDAKQTNKNLLLSTSAHVDTQPQLEIFADDVKCTHGATIGQVDEDAIFYLRCRGIPEIAARSLLTYAFARETLCAVQIPQLRRQVEDLLLARLPQGELFKELT